LLKLLWWINLFTTDKNNPKNTGVPAKLIYIAVIVNVVGMIIFLILISSSDSGFSNRRQHSSSWRWSFSASQAHGGSNPRVRLSEEDLSNLRITSHIDEGEMFLVFTQGDRELRIDLSQPMVLYADDIDFSVFELGFVMLRVEFNRAKNVRVEIRWG